MVTIIGAWIGLCFMLFGVLLLIFGGSRRVVVHHHERPERRREVAPPKIVEVTRAPKRELRDDAVDDFRSAVMLYQKHIGCSEPSEAIRMLATDALRRQGFLK